MKPTGAIQAVIVSLAILAPSINCLPTLTPQELNNVGKSLPEVVDGLTEDCVGAECLPTRYKGWPPAEWFWPRIFKQG